MPVFEVGNASPNSELPIIEPYYIVMPPRRKPPAESPDPLLIYEIIEPVVDEIIVDGPPEPPAKPPPSKRPRTTKSVESSPIRPSETPARTKARTPLSRSVTKKEPSARTTPSRASKSQVIPIGAKATPVKTGSEAKVTLGSSTKNALPTPSRNPAKTETLRTPTKRKATHKDVETNPFGDEKDVSKNTASPTTAAITRETFLANEALKRQREARNFKYKGDANAPRQTRSGRVVREANTEEVDEFGEMGMEPPYEAAEEEEEEEIEVIEYPTKEVEIEGSAIAIQHELDGMAELEEETRPTVAPLSPFARQHISSILSTITSQSIASDPGSFRDEDQNEALQGLLKLLQGTVERGEGNSALVTGPRGVGKTRVRHRTGQIRVEH